MDWMPGTLEYVMYIFSLRKYEPKDQQLGVLLYVSYPLKVLFVEAQGQFFSDSFPEDQISRFQIMQSCLGGCFGNEAYIYWC